MFRAVGKYVSIEVVEEGSEVGELRETRWGLKARVGDTVVLAPAKEGNEYAYVTIGDTVYAVVKPSDIIGIVEDSPVS